MAQASRTARATPTVGPRHRMRPTSPSDRVRMLTPASAYGKDRPIMGPLDPGADSTSRSRMARRPRARWARWRCRELGARRVIAAAGSDASPGWASPLHVGGRYTNRMNPMSAHPSHRHGRRASRWLLPEHERKGTESFMHREMEGSRRYCGPAWWLVARRAGE